MKKSHYTLLYCCIEILFVLMSLTSPLSLNTQKCVSYKDIEDMMKNMKEASMSFRENFDNALKKSAIRRTSQEKDAKGLISSFEKQTDSMFSEFKKTKRGDVA